MTARQYIRLLKMEIWQSCRCDALRKALTIKSVTTIGHVFVPLDREHDGTVPTDNDQARFESLPVPLALWEPFQQCLSKHLSELTEGQIDRDETFSFEAAKRSTPGT